MLKDFDPTKWEDFQEKIYYVVDLEDQAFELSYNLSLKAGNDRRMFGKNHSKTAYNYYEKIKNKHRMK